MVYPIPTQPILKLPYMICKCLMTTSMLLFSSVFCFIVQVGWGGGRGAGGGQDRKAN